MGAVVGRTDIIAAIDPFAAGVLLKSGGAGDRTAVAVDHGLPDLERVAGQSDQPLHEILVGTDQRDVAGREDESLPYFRPDEIVAEPVHEELVAGQFIKGEHAIAGLHHAAGPDAVGRHAIDQAGLVGAAAHLFLQPGREFADVLAVGAAKEGLGDHPVEIEVQRELHRDRLFVHEERVFAQLGRENDPRAAGDQVRMHKSSVLGAAADGHDDLAINRGVEAVRPGAERDGPRDHGHRAGLVGRMRENLRCHAVVRRPHGVRRDLERLHEERAEADDHDRRDQEELDVLDQRGLRVDRAAGAAEHFLQCLDAQLELRGLGLRLEALPERIRPLLQLGALLGRDDVAAEVPDLLRDLEPVGRVFAHLGRL